MAAARTSARRDRRRRAPGVDDASARRRDRQAGRTAVARRSTGRAVHHDAGRPAALLAVVDGDVHGPVRVLDELPQGERRRVAGDRLRALERAGHPRPPLPGSDGSANTPGRRRTSLPVGHPGADRAAALAREQFLRGDPASSDRRRCSLDRHRDRLRGRDGRSGPRAPDLWTATANAVREIGRNGPPNCRSAHTSRPTQRNADEPAPGSGTGSSACEVRRTSRGARGWACAGRSSGSRAPGRPPW